MFAVEDTWHQHKDGQWSVEISTLQGTPFYTGGIVSLPHAGNEPLSLFTTHRDDEGDITHWTLNKAGVKYTIWND